MILVAKMATLSPPSRWNDDPKQGLTCTLQGAAVVKWLRALEEVALPKVPGVGDPRSCVKTNPFAETFVRAKLTPQTRFFDAAGKQQSAYVDSVDVFVMLALRPYCFAGAKGMSVKLIGVQPA